MTTSGTRAILARLATLAVAVTVATAAQARDGPGEVRFNRDIRPILADRCFACHGPDAGRRKAELRLDVESNAKARRENGPAIAPGDPEGSELVFRVTVEDETLRMPPKGHGKPVSANEAALLRRWIEQGAGYERHWSLVPPERPVVPAVERGDWPLGAIDRFLLAKIEAAGMEPAAESDRVTLIRRLSFDLTGLPPTVAEVEAFQADDRPDAYERLVDRLLASPHFGERLAMYWLDLVRYADTVGYHGDQEHHISPYRDYVINAFNANMPFDRFTVEQLAGDLLPGATVEAIVATGYNRVLQTTHEGGTQDKEYRAKYAADRVRNVSVVWMGATMGCAECHDHKFDPYTQRDFYSLAAFFADIRERGAFPGPDITPTVRAPERDVLISQADRDELERVTSQTDTLTDLLGGSAADVKGSPWPGEAALFGDLLETLRWERRAIEGRERRTMITEAVEPRTMRVLPRGDWMDESGPVVEPAVPESIGGLGVESRKANRLDLAHWLTSPRHPQTARVFVNRLWYLFFGEGLSRSLDDNGAQGEWPTHPELLDWLAVEFADGGWDVKGTVRLIVTSRAYRQSSVVDRGTSEQDPENRLFARQGRFRLPAEMIRDSALVASGLLVARVGGPSARPYQPVGYYQPLNFPRREYQADQDGNQYRRGVYTHWQRQFLHPMLRAFDAPTREECTARRPISNTPLAALTLLNDPSFIEAARGLATRAIREGGPTPVGRIRQAWRIALSRMPEDREVAALLRHYEQSRSYFSADPETANALLGVGLASRPEGIDAVELAAWTSVARAILNLHESITRY